MNAKLKVNPQFANKDISDQTSQHIFNQTNDLPFIFQVVSQYKVYFIFLVLIILSPTLFGIFFYKQSNSVLNSSSLSQSEKARKDNKNIKDNIVQTESEVSSYPEVMTPTPSLKNRNTPTPYNSFTENNNTIVTGQSSITATATPISSPTLAPTVADYHFSNYGKLIRQYNDGSGSGYNTSYYDYSSNPSFDPVISLWNDSVKACVQIQDNNFSPNLWVSLIIEDNGNQISARDIHPGDEICTNLSIASGQHQIKMSLNSGKAITETNYNNNVLQFNYTMNPDTQAPTYDIFGPIKVDGQGTCVFAQHLSDNITFNSDIHLEQYIDNQLLTPDQYGRVCIQTNAGESHSYKAKATDQAGNTNEQSKQFIAL